MAPGSEKGRKSRAKKVKVSTERPERALDEEVIGAKVKAARSNDAYSMTDREERRKRGMLLV